MIRIISSKLLNSLCLVWFFFSCICILLQGKAAQQNDTEFICELLERSPRLQAPSPPPFLFRSCYLPHNCVLIEAILRVLTNPLYLLSLVKWLEFQTMVVSKKSHFLALINKGNGRSAATAQRQTAPAWHHFSALRKNHDKAAVTAPALEPSRRHLRQRFGITQEEEHTCCSYSSPVH